MLVEIAYDRLGDGPGKIHRTIEFDGPEQDIIDWWNAVLNAAATGDTRFKAEGGTNADLVSSTAAPVAP